MLHMAMRPQSITETDDLLFRVYSLIDEHYGSTGKPPSIGIPQPYEAVLLTRAFQKIANREERAFVQKLLEALSEN